MRRTNRMSNGRYATPFALLLELQANARHQVRGGCIVSVPLVETG
jgi:hypothetical protein